MLLLSFVVVVVYLQSSSNKKMTKKLKLKQKIKKRTLNLWAVGRILEQKLFIYIVVFILLCYIENHLKVRRDDKDHKRYHHTC